MMDKKLKSGNGMGLELMKSVDETRACSRANGCLGGFSGGFQVLTDLSGHAGEVARLLTGTTQSHLPVEKSASDILLFAIPKGKEWEGRPLDRYPFKKIREFGRMLSLCSTPSRSP